jgi:hypothetical protein
VSLKGALIALAIAVLAVIAGGIGGFLSHAYLEIWFDPVEGVQATNLATWPKLADGLRGNFDLTDPQSYRAYYGENAGDGVTEISTAKIVLRNFQLSGRLIGVKQKEVNGKIELYSLSGYSNSERMGSCTEGSKGRYRQFLPSENAGQRQQYFLLRIFPD